jgi:hypothetical protein
MRVCGLFCNAKTEAVIMVLYHLSVKIIGRGSGRSAIGAAAYRSGGILRSAAYRAGEELRDETGEIVHDYTKKGGVVHSEIILPVNAPPEYIDREILWNAVEAREIRKDAQLAREIEVALQTEFGLQENIELLREYIKENFVDKGMIADFAIHDKGNGNPHVHIMLTTRHVTPDGFGKKNRDWDKKAELYKWREKWTEINNRKFEQKGLSERIDHRTLEAQGIDREPTIHLGHEATKLEKKGKRSKRGDINREIERRNAERAAQKAAEKTEHTQEITENTANIDNEIINTNENLDDEHTIEKTAQHLNKLKEYYTTLEQKLSELITQRNEERQEIPRLNYRAELTDEHAKNIEVLQSRVAKLQETRQNLNVLQWVKRQEADKAIKQAGQEAQRAERFFKNRFYIDPDQAPSEINRLQKIARAKEVDISTKNAAILDIMDTQDKVLLGYHTQKLLAEAQHDKEHLNKLLEQIHKPPETLRDRPLQKRIDRRLNIIPDENFQKVLEKLPQEYAQILTEERKRAKTIEREQEKIRERNQTIERSR